MMKKIIFKIVDLIAVQIFPSSNVTSLHVGRVLRCPKQQFLSKNLKVKRRLYRRMSTGLSGHKTNWNQKLMLIKWVWPCGLCMSHW